MKQDILTEEQIEYYKTHQNEITTELLDALRQKGNIGKQLCLDILDTPTDSEEYHIDAFGNRITFNGNRDLKKPHTNMNLAPIHISELKKCSEDLDYFKCNYVKIKTRKGVNFPDIRKYQNDFLKILNSPEENIVALLSRQSGKSITVSIYLCWLYCFKYDMNMGICANKGKLAREFLNNVKNIYLELPIWFQVGTVVWNTGSIANENGMRILTDVPSSDAFRGFTCAVLVIDEHAFIPSNRWNEVADSVLPSQSALSWKKNIFISTANGINHFYNIVQGARTHKVLRDMPPDTEIELKDNKVETLEEYYNQNNQR